MAEELPNHITISDRQIREIRTICRHCEAQASIGPYPEDPEQADVRLAEWVQRHLHKGNTK